MQKNMALAFQGGRDAHVPHSHSGPSDLVSGSGSLWQFLQRTSPSEKEWGTACTQVGQGGVEGKNAPGVMWVWENGVGEV